MQKDLKKKLSNRERTLGSWLSIGSTVTAEIMANAGYDWLAIDMEHSAITLDIALEMIRVVDLCGVPPLVRVGHNQPNLIKRVMDCGATGVIVPMVNSAEEAEQAVASVKYPPRGFRGVGLARAQRYGYGFDEYKQWVEDSSVVIVQVEHIQAVNNLEAILAVDGVDGFIVGPYDLSGSLGVPGQFDHPEVVDALERVLEVSKQKNALSGFHVIPPEAEALKVRLDEGYKFVAHSLDFMFLANGSHKAVAGARKVLGDM